MTVKFGPKTYTKTKFSALSGATHIVFREECTETPLVVTCRPDGVSLSGQFNREFSDTGEGMELVTEIRELLLAAHEARESLKPKLHSSLSGH